MKQRFWRFASPSTLLFALLLFPLPWIEIQCPTFMTGKNEMTRKAAEPSPPPPANSSPAAEPPDWIGGIFGYFFGPRRSVLVSQSGIQAMCGWWSFGGDIDEDKPQTLRIRRELDAGIQPSPLLGLHFGLLVIGSALAFALRPGRWRSVVVATVAAIALILVFIQLAARFPLDDAYCRVPWREVLEEPSRFGSSEAAGLRNDIGFTAWFWMAQGSLVFAILLQPAEWWFVYRRGGVSAIENAEPAEVAPALAD